MFKKLLVLSATGLVALFAVQSHASIVSYALNTTSGGTHYQAQADFQISGGMLEMTLTNKTTDSGGFSAADSICNVTFTVGGDLGTQASNLTFREISGSRTNVTTTASVDITGNPLTATKDMPSGDNPAANATHWQFSTAGAVASNLTVNGIGGKPWDMILPQGATGSDSSNSQHLPQFMETANLFYAFSGTLPSSLTAMDITGVTFAFGTNPDFGPDAGTLVTTPEPSSILTWGLLAGAAGVAALRRGRATGRWSKENRAAIPEAIGRR